MHAIKEEVWLAAGVDLLTTALPGTKAVPVLRASSWAQLHARSTLNLDEDRSQV